MKKDPSFVFRLILMVGDALAIIFAFAFAYIIRTNFDSRPYYFEDALPDFIITIFLLLPVWWFIIALLGLYRKEIFRASARPRERRMPAGGASESVRRAAAGRLPFRHPGGTSF